MVTILNFVSISFLSVRTKKAGVGVQIGESTAPCFQLFSLFSVFHRHKVQQHLGQKKIKIRQFAKLGLQIRRTSSINSLNLKRQFVRVVNFCGPIELGLQMLQRFHLFAQQFLLFWAVLTKNTCIPNPR
jgi:hypothetical protein